MAQSYNSVTLMGRLTKDPEVKQTTTGKNVCPFTIAVDKGYGQEGTNFFDCESWNKTAEFVGQYLKKGDLVLVDGRLDQQTWEKDGQKRSTIRVVVNTVQSLSSKKEKAETQETTEAPVQEEINLSDIPF